MANPFRRLLDKLKKPELPEGRRGRTAPPDKEIVSQGEIEDFLYAGMPLFVSSDYMVMATYSLADQKMVVEYDDGSIWAYDPLSEAQMIAFAHASSKGSFMWSNVRVRGTKHAHRCNAVQIR